jgi:hypothetical protein
MTSIIDAVYLSNTIEMIKVSRLPVSNPILETESSVLSIVPIAFTEEIRQENATEVSDGYSSVSPLKSCVKRAYVITELACGLMCLLGVCGLTLYGPFWLLNISC